MSYQWPGKMKINLKKVADPKKAEIFKVATKFGKTEVIRWTKNNNIQT